MTGVSHVPEGVLDAMRAVVDYDWQTEQRDYEAEGKPAGHVFEHLQALDTWLQGVGK